MKPVIEKEKFIDLLHDGITIMVGGFMAVGTPEVLIDYILEANIKDITIICNDAGYPDKGVGKLIVNNQVKKLIASHIGLNPIAGKLYNEGKMEIELVPQGTLVERIRSGGAGLGGFLTKTGLGTSVEDGKNVLFIDGEYYILEKPLKAELALIRGSHVDYYGNVIYNKTTRNFNPIMATAANKVVVWAKSVEEELDKEKIMTPHIFIDYIVR